MSAKALELLVPAGGRENLEVAILYGASAVYMGGEQFGLRAKAKNFTDSELFKAIDYAHEHGVKVYVTANIIAHNADLEPARAYFESMKQNPPDALIVADPGMLMLVKEVLPDMPIHLSTQANNTNYGAFNFWHSQGVKRVVAARELSLEELITIRQNIDPELQIEAFVHGAMCISYSGRCLLSNYMTGQDANQGACNHPCRWNYHVVEEQRPGQYMPVVENERGTFIFNAKDLCMVGHLDALIRSGIDSFKIEGRMKTPLYVATVTRTYKAAMADYLKDPALFEANRDHYLDEIEKCSHRHYADGFYYGKPTPNHQIYDTNSYIRPYAFVAKVLSYDGEKRIVTLEQRNRFLVGDTLEVMHPDGRNIPLEVTKIIGSDGEEKASAPHPKETVQVPCEALLEPGWIIRKIETT